MAAAVLVLVIGAGCGTNRTPNPAALPEGPRRIPLLRVAITEPASIDPLTASTRWGVFAVKLICDTLVAFDPENGKLKPAIAESWSIAPDAKSVTFKLRNGLKFHNGRDVTAEDYVWSMSRFAHPKSGSSERFLFEEIAGYQDLQQGKSETLAGVKAVDPRTLEISLSSPYAELPAVMAHPSAGAAIPREEVEKSPEAFAAKPLCSGPYLLEAPWSSTDGIRLAKFPDYYAANAAYSQGGRGYADKVTLTVAADEQEGYRLLRSGGADVATVPLDRLSAARAVPGRVSYGVNGHVAYVGFPTNRPPYDNQQFRRALALSVDRGAIIEGLLGNSRRLPGSFLPPSAGSAAECSETIKKASDSKAAQAALTASGVDAAGVKPAIYFNAHGGHEKWLEAVAEHWKSALGLESSLKPQEWQKYLDFLVEPGPDGPFRLAWVVKIPSPEALFEPLFTSGSLDNFTRFANPEFDALIAKARSIPGDSERRSTYLEAGMILCREMPIVPMWFGQNHLGFAAGLTHAAGSAGARIDIFGDPVVREIASSR